MTSLIFKSQEISTTFVSKLNSIYTICLLELSNAQFVCGTSQIKFLSKYLKPALQ